MLDRPFSSLVTLFAAVLIALAGVASAASMAPRSVADPAIAAYLAAGGAMEDLCLDGTGPHHMAHDCPFCVLLDTRPTTAPASREARLCPDLIARMARDQIREHRAGHPHLPPRAPPVRSV